MPSRAAALSPHLAAESGLSTMRVAAASRALHGCKPASGVLHDRTLDTAAETHIAIFSVEKIAAYEQVPDASR
jgi:hypothetical protein